MSWRYGGGYAGWAPLPPDSLVGAEYGEPGVDVGDRLPHRRRCRRDLWHRGGLLQLRAGGDLGYPNYRGRFIDRSRNYTVINNTTNVTNININNNDRGGGRGGNFRGVVLNGPP